MARLRILLFLFLVAIGVGLGVFVTSQHLNTPLGRTLSPLFTLVGQGTKTVDRALTHVMPLDEIDEQKLGVAMEAKLTATYGTSDPNQQYLNDLIADLAKGSGRPFKYKVFVAPGPANAFALPGGVLAVTDGLLKIIQSEAELVAVLGHEMGHVELGHCFDSARFEMLNRKFGGRTLGEIADGLYGILIHSSFSKSQEAEADDYGFSVLTARGYDPMGESEAFEHLALAEGKRNEGGIDPFRDYFSSHPPLALRIENYRERGKRYLAQHSGERFYVGRSNLSVGLPRSQRELLNEFRP